MEKITDEELDRLFGPAKPKNGGRGLRYGLLSAALLLSLALNIVLFFSIRSLREKSGEAAITRAEAEKIRGGAAAPAVSALPADKEEEKPAAPAVTSEDKAEGKPASAAGKTDPALTERISVLERKVSRLEYENTKIVDLEHDLRKLRDKVEKK